ncbi:Do family serine endopeptidase [Rhizobium leguminosarum]|uniref:Probable periplasmic serine endoprotease DegP-like n=1 Tax=Rhizobium leguminosarum TaxID=384 RepID=A0AAJ1AAT0_RHILE|nr:Do family serine endopeptidase [Rhizobium leguminosarum]MBY5630493.1 Do family serine endopeptidase [Rhizobium leguminosarum]
MLKSFNGRPSLATVLKASTVAGIAAAVLATGVPLEITRSYAEAVKVQAPAVPSFANVVDAVSPAVVSVRVENPVNPVSDNNNDGFSFDFNGRGFDDLPDDHPLKRFFKQFGQDPNDQQGHSRRFGQNGPNGGPGGKGRLRPVAQGSGFFISEDGYIVTNNHVVSDGQAFVAVTNDGTELDAKLIGKDPRTDLAVLKVDGKGKKFTYVNWADDNNVRVGDWVVAVGNPFGLGGTVTAGIVSARGRDIGSGPYDDYLQVDAAVNRGNSGGPTFNLSGEVVGINTAIFSPSGGSVGIAFAIPASTAKDVVADLMKDGQVSRGWLGVQIQPVTKDIAESIGLSEPSGALVVAPQAGSPGDKAGMKAGDVVTALNGETIKDARDLSRRIGAMQPGSKVELSVWRAGKAQPLTVELGTLPIDQKDASADDNSQPQQPEAPASEKALADLGLTVGPSDDGKGLAITDIDPNSDAADKGIKEGEKITSVNNQEVSSADDIVKVLNQAKKDGRTRALFQIQSSEGSRFVALPINGQG